MTDFESGGNPILTIVLFSIAVVTGISGSAHHTTEEDLKMYDLVLALVLKFVSIVSFLLIIMLNFGKIISTVKGWFK